MIRSFISVDIEDINCVRNLGKIQRILSEIGADIRFVSLENIHLTLKFLGDIDPSMIFEIHNIMSRIKSDPFEVHIEGVGTFPSQNRIRIIWAGITKGIDILQNIFRELDNNLQILGFNSDRKEFRPHLTLARVRTSRKKLQLQRQLKELEGFKIGTMLIEGIKLKKSVLTSQGPEYSILEEVFFGNK